VHAKSGDVAAFLAGSRGATTLGVCVSTITIVFARTVNVLFQCPPPLFRHGGELSGHRKELITASFRITIICPELAAFAWSLVFIAHDVALRPYVDVGRP
jgi:hypothetical protein